LPSSPAAISESMARITIAGFITDLLSTFGFWLGLSALDVIVSSATLLWKLVNKSSEIRRRRRRKNGNGRIQAWNNRL
jgi:hypothetical protein